MAAPVTSESTPENGSASPRSYGGVWMLGLVGSFLEVVSLWQLLAGRAGDQRLAWIVSCLLVPLLFASVAVKAILIRLAWTSESITVRVGPFQRQVSLTALASVGYRPSGRTVVYLLRDQDGRRVRIDGGLFSMDEIWKPLILQAADRAGANVDPKARISLSHVDDTGRGRAYFA